jgi:recombination protein RecR
MMQYSSKIIEQAVDAFSQLPGVGKKTALRYVLHLIKQNTDETSHLSQIIQQLKTDLKFCIKCHNICEQEYCEVCNNKSRDKSLVCVVQDYRDVMAIENTGLFRGLYHVLGGLISPMDGVGPGNLNIESLVQRVSEEEIKEVILALNATMEGETTSFYIYRKLAPHSVELSAIARGIAVGDELEYADEATLGKSLTNRMPFSTFFTVK